MTDDEKAAEAASFLAGPAVACGMALRNYYQRTGQKPGYLLLGWETWLALGKDLRAFGIPRLQSDVAGLAAGGPGEFEGTPVVVDETVGHLLRVLPQLKNVRPRTRPSHLAYGGDL